MAGLVRVTHGINDLANDMRSIPRKAVVDMNDCVRDGIRVGNDLAKDFARAHVGPHTKKYPGSFSSRMNKPYQGFGAIIFSGEYGPLARGQGELASVLERGTRNGNKPQFNVLRSADMIGPAFAHEVGKLPDRWFW